MKFLISLIVSTYLFAGCNTNTQPVKPVAPSFKKEMLDTIGEKKYKPGFDKSDSFTIQLMEAHDGIKYTTRSIEHSVDSLNIKITARYSSMTGTDTYFIFYENSAWQCEHTSTLWNPIWNDIIKGTFEKVSPQCGWKHFMDTLNISGFYDMPTQQQIKGFHDTVDDNSEYVVEFATKNRYKLFKYRTPDKYRDSTDEKFYSLISFFYKSLEPYENDNAVQYLKTLNFNIHNSSK